MTTHELTENVELAAAAVAARRPELAVRLNHAVRALRRFHHELRRIDMATLDIVGIVDKVEKRLADLNAQVAAERSRGDRLQAQIDAEAPNVLTPEQAAAVQKLDNDLTPAPAAEQTAPPAADQPAAEPVPAGEQASPQ